MHKHVICILLKELFFFGRFWRPLWTNIVTAPRPHVAQILIWLVFATVLKDRESHCKYYFYSLGTAGCTMHGNVVMYLFVTM